MFYNLADVCFAAKMFIRARASKLSSIRKLDEALNLDEMRVPHGGVRLPFIVFDNVNLLRGSVFEHGASSVIERGTAATSGGRSIVVSRSWASAEEAAEHRVREAFS